MTSDDKPQTGPETEVIELFGIPVRALKNVPGMPPGRLFVPASESLDVLRRLKAIGLAQIAAEKDKPQ